MTIGLLPAIGRAIGPLALAAALVACTPRRDDTPLDISVIGAAPTLGRPAMPFDRPQQALVGATGLGLVRLDATGQLVPGLAVRWAIEAEGADIILRLDDAQPLTAREATLRLRRLLRADRLTTSSLRQAVIAVSPVTESVIELRLNRPRPDMLPLFGKGEFAALAPGAGPYRAMLGTPGTPGSLRLVSRHRDTPLPPIILRGEPAGRAVARFAAGRAAAVLGGTFADLPIARAIDPRRRLLRFDNAIGLFGFAVRARSGPLADPATIEALGLALDRDRIVRLIDAAGSKKATTVGGSTIEPAAPDRHARAIGLLSRFGGHLPRVRVAMPAGPGAHLLFRLVADDWARIGVAAEAVPPADPDADLLLVDATMPAGERPYAACAAAPGCNPDDPAALLRPPFVPIAAPVRWALVSPRLGGFAENPLAAHPLDQLR